MKTINDERYGVLIKEEVVKDISSKGLENTMVLETPEPFPGFLQYYSETPYEVAPQFVYLGIDEQMHFDDIARSTNGVREKYLQVGAVVSASFTATKKIQFVFNNGARSMISFIGCIA